MVIIMKECKDALIGFFKEYGRIMLALLGIALVIYIMMESFSVAGRKDNARVLTEVVCKDQTPFQHWDLTAEDFRGTQ